MVESDMNEIGLGLVVKSFSQPITHQLILCSPLFASVALFF